MKAKAYLETSVVSYLTAWRSRDLVLAAHQQVTRDWWMTRENFELFASQFVLDEAAAGDEGAAARRLAALAEVAVLEVTEHAVLLAERLIAATSLTPRCVAKLRSCAERPASSRRSSVRRWNCPRSSRDGTGSDHR